LWVHNSILASTKQSQSDKILFGNINRGTKQTFREELKITDKKGFVTKKEMTASKWRVNPMTKVFIGGSRNIKEINDKIKEHLDNIINKQYQVLIGDSYGADRAVQQYLHEMDYRNVAVYCSGAKCRNNLGHWKVINIHVPSNLKGDEFYAVKDISMAQAADWGFMLWDGKSSGTLSNIFNILSSNKIALLYFAPKNHFYTITTAEDIKELLEKYGKAGFKKL